MQDRIQVGRWITLIVTLVAGSADAADPAVKCQAAKLKETGKYGLCRFQAEAKAVKRGSTAKLPAALAKCDATLATKWAALEAKSHGTCPTSGDAGGIQSVIIDASHLATLQLVGTRFIDNGNGTITDTRTRLTWEKKNGADGVADPGNPHDVDNTYTWSTSGAAPDGTVFTQFLGALNTCFSTFGNDGFAGHCDWRLPTYEELLTLFDPDLTGCPMAVPCIDPVFIPLAYDVVGRIGAFYWSSISIVGTNNANAWGYDFTNCFCPKSTSLFARAVRDDLEPEVLP